MSSRRLNVLGEDDGGRSSGCDISVDPRRKFVCVAGPKSAQIFRFDTGEPVASSIQVVGGVGVSASIQHTEIAADGKRLLTTTTSGVARLWQIPSPETTGPPWRSLVHSISGGRIDDTGTLIAIEPSELQNAWSNWQARPFEGIVDDETAPTSVREGMKHEQE